MLGRADDVEMDRLVCVGTLRMDQHPRESSSCVESSTEAPPTKKRWVHVRLLRVLVTALDVTQYLLPLQVVYTHIAVQA